MRAQHHNAMLSELIRTRPMSQHEWQSWAGSPGFGTEKGPVPPLVTYMRNTTQKHTLHRDMVIIGDEEGIAVHFRDPDRDDEYWYYMVVEDSPSTSVGRVYDQDSAYWLCRAVVKMALHGQFSIYFKQGNAAGDNEPTEHSFSVNTTLTLKCRDRAEAESKALEIAEKINLLLLDFDGQCNIEFSEYKGSGSTRAAWLRSEGE